MSPDCQCGCPGERHRGEPPYPCLDCECKAFAERVFPRLNRAEDAPTPNQREEREEREEIEAFYKVVHYVGPNCGLCDTDADTDHREDCPLAILADSLRTHSPEEPVGYIVVGVDAGDEPNPGTAPRRVFRTLIQAEEIRERLEQYGVFDAYVIFPIGQPLDGDG